MWNGVCCLRQYPSIDACTHPRPYSYGLKTLVARRLVLAFRSIVGLEVGEVVEQSNPVRETRKGAYVALDSCWDI